MREGCEELVGFGRVFSFFILVVVVCLVSLEALGRTDIR